MGFIESESPNLTTLQVQLSGGTAEASASGGGKKGKKGKKNKGIVLLGAPRPNM